MHAHPPARSHTHTHTTHDTHTTHTHTHTHTTHDTQDPRIQDLLFEVIKVSIDIDAKMVAKKASAVRSAHRSPKYIDELVRLATERSG